MDFRFAYVLVAAAGLAGGDAHAACGSGKVLFTDTFDKHNPAWGDPDEWMSTKDGHLVIAEKGGNFYAAYADPKYRNVDFCGELVLNVGTDIANSRGGLAFWMKDSDHFYTMQITLDGYIAIYQYDDGDWNPLIDDEPFDAIKQGIGKVNELRVVTRGPRATFYVNGQKFDTVTEKTAPGTSHVGLMVDSPQKGAATYFFDNISVREVTE